MKKAARRAGYPLKENTQYVADNYSWNKARSHVDHFQCVAVGLDCHASYFFPSTKKNCLSCTASIASYVWPLAVLHYTTILHYYTAHNWKNTPFHSCIPPQALLNYMKCSTQGFISLIVKENNKSILHSAFLDMMLQKLYIRHNDPIHSFWLSSNSSDTHHKKRREEM